MIGVLKGVVLAIHQGCSLVIDQRQARRTKSEFADSGPRWEAHFRGVKPLLRTLPPPAPSILPYPQSQENGVQDAVLGDEGQMMLPTTCCTGKPKTGPAMLGETRPVSLALTADSSFPPCPGIVPTGQKVGEQDICRGWETESNHCWDSSTLVSNG